MKVTPKTFPTPQSLMGAVFNACEEQDIKVSAAFVECIVKHVKDYLAQRFSAALMRELPIAEIERINRLWAKIIGEGK